MRFERRSLGIQVMFPSNSGLAEVEPIFPFHSKHPACDRMVNLRLQFADKAVECPHLENRHEAQIFQHPALAGNDVESVVKSVKTSVRAGLPFKMMSSQVCLQVGEFGQGGVHAHTWALPAQFVPQLTCGKRN